MYHSPSLRSGFYPLVIPMPIIFLGTDHSKLVTLTSRRLSLEGSSQECQQACFLQIRGTRTFSSFLSYKELEEKATVFAVRPDQNPSAALCELRTRKKSPCIDSLNIENVTFPFNMLKCI